MLRLITAIHLVFVYLYKIFFRGSFKEPALGDTLRILQNAKGKNKKEEETTDKQCEKHVGTITFVNDQFGLINRSVFFEYLFMSDFELGMQVEYYTCRSEGKTIVYEVVPPPEPETESDEDLGSHFRRKIITQVIKRDGRKVFAEPHNIKFNLNSVYSTFIPLVGDWLELVCVVEINEELSNLTGDIVKIEKVAPVRKVTITGKIRKYSQRSNAGQIEDDITFEKMSCSPGYIPVVGDVVTAEVIESEYKHCVWRALKVRPSESPSESLSRHSRGIIDTHNFDLTDIHFGNRNAVLVSRPAKITLAKLGQEAQFSISVRNSNSTTQKILDVQFIIKESQISLLHPRRSVSVSIGSAKTFKVQLKCEAKFMGATKELVIIQFEKVKIGRWINIFVGPCDENVATRKYHTNEINLAQSARKMFFDGEKNLVIGQRPVRPPAFIINKLPLYEVPEKIADKIFQELMKLHPDVSIHSVAPCLQQDVTPKTYKNKFHMLLYMEEVTVQVHVRKFDMQRVIFVRNGQYFTLEVPNLNERRPSIVQGDRVIATNPNDPSEHRFEGYVHKTGAQRLYLQFNPQFHNAYNGEDFTVHFMTNRTNYRRSHHAINIAYATLHPGILFPENITVKPPQVKFIEEDGNKRNKTQDVRFKKYKVLRWINKSLNEYQKFAIKNILHGIARPFPYLLFGPPGTGKTVTVVEAILQINALIPHSRILVVGPSNAAADLIALRLLDSKVLLPGDLVRMVAFRCVVDKTIPQRLIPYSMTGDIAREGSRESKEHTQNGVRMCVRASDVFKHRIIIATCSVVGTLYTMGSKPGSFTHIVMDEAGQIAEPEAMIPLSLFDMQKSQVILAGDPLQLGPCIFSALSRKYGLAQSYFERLISSAAYERDFVGFPDTDGYDPRVITRLVYNYRSLPEILYLPNQLFYNDELIPKISDERGMEVDLLRQLKDILPKRTHKNGLPPPVVFHGVRGKNIQSEDSPSWYNSQEAGQVLNYLQKFYHVGLTSKDIGIITPYTKQGSFIREIIHEAEIPLPKIGSVEEFQGQEFNVVILSTVRSNESGARNDSNFGLGFVASSRRLNVAVTRARALLVIVGNPYLLLTDYYWRSVIFYAVKIGGYRGCDLPDF